MLFHKILLVCLKHSPSNIKKIMIKMKREVGMNQEVHEKLLEWADKGLLNGDTIEAILAYESKKASSIDSDPSSTPAAVHKESRLGEIFAYIGGLIIVNGCLALMSDVWDKFPEPVRFAFMFLFSLVFFMVGYRLFRAENSGAMQRLGSFLSTLGVFLFGVSILYLFGEILDISESVATLSTSGAVSIVAARFFLWFHSHEDAFVRGSASVLYAFLSGLVSIFVFTLMDFTLEITESKNFMITTFILSPVSVFLMKKYQTEMTNLVAFVFVNMFAHYVLDFMGISIYDPVGMMALWFLSILWIIGSLREWIVPRIAGVVLGAMMLPILSVGLMADTTALGASFMLCTGGLFLYLTTHSYSMRLFLYGSICILLGAPTLLYDLFSEIVPISILLIVLGVVLLGGGLFLNRIRIQLSKKESGTQQEKNHIPR